MPAGAPGQMFPSFSLGRKTAGGGTAFQLWTPARKLGRAKISKMAFTCAATAHTLTAMTELSHTTVVGVVAASATTFKIARDPGKFAANNLADGRRVTQSADIAIAANHWYAVRLPDDTIFLDQVSSVTTNADGTVTVTPTATIPTGGFLANAVFWFYGATTSVNPNTSLAHQSWLGTVNAQLPLGDDGGSVVEAQFRDSPIILYDNNATNAGSIDYVSGVYAPA